MCAPRKNGNGSIATKVLVHERQVGFEQTQAEDIMWACALATVWQKFGSQNVSQNCRASAIATENCARRESNPGHKHGGLV